MRAVDARDQHSLCLLQNTLIMNTYIIFRRRGWATTVDLEKAASRGCRVSCEEMPEKIRWMRSYITREGVSRVGIVCVYEAADIETVREHARRADLPCDAIIPVSCLVVGNDHAGMSLPENDPDPPENRTVRPRPNRILMGPEGERDQEMIRTRKGLQTAQLLKWTPSNQH